MTRTAAKRAYKEAGITPEQVSVIELHDCVRSLPIFPLGPPPLADSAPPPRQFAANELLLYDSLQLTPPGKAHTLVDSKDNTYGGRYVIKCARFSLSLFLRGFATLPGP